MTGKSPGAFGLKRSLSARVLLLTIFFVMLGEVVVFLPSLARFRYNYLETRIAAARIATLALNATPDNSVSPSLQMQLLYHVGASGIVLHLPNQSQLMIASDMPPTVDITYDLRDAGFFELIADAVATLARSGDTILRVLDTSPKEQNVVVEILLGEGPMRTQMWEFGGRILTLSIVISLITAALVFLSLRGLLVAPMRRITGSMMAFRDNPEDASRVIEPSARDDEIGVAERALAEMQETVRQALRQSARLAALGTAVTKINHDLRNILSTARLVSDSLAGSEAPEVKRAVPRLLDAIDRAVALCSGTLNFTREGAPPLKVQRFLLASMVEELADLLELKGGDRPLLIDRVPPDLAVEADREQLHRVLMNLVRNAMEAGAHGIVVSAEARDAAVAVEISDDGPGLPPKALANLFLPFAGSARPGGTGLGLAIAREVMRAHGGDIVLSESTEHGTIFRLSLPRMGAAETDAQRTQSPIPSRTERTPSK
jgi:signal transduction histidine kinase